MKIMADATVDIGGGPYGSGIRGTVTLPAEIEFKDKFCSIHPGYEIRYNEEYDDHYGASKKDENWFCPECEKFAEKRFGHRLDEATIDCVKNLNHGHGCECNLGHDCNKHDCVVQAQLDREREKAAETGEEVNEMMILGAEAPSKVMMSVYKRLEALEAENAGLKKLLVHTVNALPEECREALRRAKVLLPAESIASD